MSSPKKDRQGLAASTVSSEVRARALKERVYASFTGLAIVTVFAADINHVDPRASFLSLLAGIVGISLAGFVADIIAHQVEHKLLPNPREVREMALIAGGALASASVPLIALASAWIGWLSTQLALQISVGIYFATLAVILLAAAARTRLPWRQQLISLVVLFGLGLLVVFVLSLAHGH